MLVNSIDIANFKSILLSKDIQTANIITYDDWLRNSLNPIFLGKQEQHKQIKLKLFIEDISEENALNDISNIMKQFEKCILKFDDLSFYYDCLIVSKNHERIAIGRYNLEIELKGYAYKSEVIETANRVATKTINIQGNLETPAIVEITPSIALVDLVVTGLGEPFTLKNLAAGQKIIVNGEDCTVLQGTTNRFSDYDSWDFPVLSPGANTITFSKSSCDVSIKYKPRWI